MFDRLVLILIGIFLTLFGLLAVTNIQIEWSKPLMGFSALAAGLICLIRAFAGGGWSNKPCP